MAELKRVEEVVNSGSSRVDYGKAIGWYFSDPLFWSNVLKFSLFFLSIFLIFPIFYVGPVLFGFMIQISRNVQKGEYKLPEFGAEGQWKEGLMIMLFSMGLGTVVSIFMSLVITPLTFSIGYLGDSNEVMILFFVVLLVVQLAFTLLLTVVSFAIQGIYAKTGDFNSMLSIDNYRYVIKNNWKKMVVSLIVIYGVALGFSIVGFLVFCVGIIPAYLAIYIVMATIVGQLDVDEVV